MPSVTPAEVLKKLRKYNVFLFSLPRIQIYQALPLLTVAQIPRKWGSHRAMTTVVNEKRVFWSQKTLISNKNALLSIKKAQNTCF
jgi:hypothetical protein